MWLICCIFFPRYPLHVCVHTLIHECTQRPEVGAECYLQLSPLHLFATWSLTISGVARFGQTCWLASPREPLVFPSLVLGRHAPPCLAFSHWRILLRSSGICQAVPVVQKNGTWWPHHEPIPLEKAYAALMPEGIQPKPGDMLLYTKTWSLTTWSNWNLTCISFVILTIYQAKDKGNLSDWLTLFCKSGAS